MNTLSKITIDYYLNKPGCSLDGLNLKTKFKKQKRQQKMRIEIEGKT